MIKDTIIVAVKYNEPEWFETWVSIKECNVPVILVDRDGTGSLAKAYNDGYAEVLRSFPQVKYIWFVSNIVFDQSILSEMIEEMENKNYSAIHPSFHSDHKHLQPILNHPSSSEADFLEFTAPLVKASIMIPLDETMPYWGHDLDWSYRMISNGHKLGVHYATQVQHTYIRNNKHPSECTKIRKELRKLWDDATEKSLVKKYGTNWKVKLKYHG